MRAEVYNDGYAGMWDDFVSHSRNGTFLLRRPYMDYHAHRFTDASLLFFNEKNRLCGVFAANSCSEGQAIEAHGGLTYGGLVLEPQASTLQAIEMLSSAADLYACSGFKRLSYKAIPYIYHADPAQEDLYALFLSEAKLEARAVSTVIDLHTFPQFHELRRRKVRKAAHLGLCIAEKSEESEWRSYHTLLSSVLQEYHQVVPVHSADELWLLAQRFPRNIRLFTVSGSDLQAGVVVYDTGIVYHLQYIAANGIARSTCALDALMDYIVRQAFDEGRRYLDFGISTERGGRYLNTGLIFQKEGYGGHAVCYDTYLVELNKMAGLCK